MLTSSPTNPEGYSISHYHDRWSWEQSHHVELPDQESLEAEGQSGSLQLRNQGGDEGPGRLSAVPQRHQRQPQVI